MSVGVKALDDDHKMLVVLVNKLCHALKRHANKEIVKRYYFEMRQCMHKHAMREERLLEKTGYPDLMTQKEEHRYCKNKLDSIQIENKDDKESFLTIEIMTSLCKWWKKHIQSDDKKYMKYLNAHGIH